MSVCLSDRGSIRLSVGNQLVKPICCFFSLNLSWIFLFLVLDKNHGRWKNVGAPKWCKLSTESPYDMESLSTFNGISLQHGVCLWASSFRLDGSIFVTYYLAITMRWTPSHILIVRACCHTHFQCISYLSPLALL